MTTLSALLFGVLVGFFARRRNRCPNDRRLGQLFLPPPPVEGISEAQMAVIVQRMRQAAATAGPVHAEIEDGSPR